MGDLFPAGLPVLLATAEEGGRKFGLLSPDPGLILWTVLTFFVLLILLRKTAWGPIVDGLDRREENIRAALKEADEAREESRKVLAEQQAALAEARKEAQGIIDQGAAMAKTLHAELVTKAQAEAGEILASARREIQLEADRARESLRAEVVDLSLQVAGKLLERSLGDADHERLAREFMSEVEKS
ncbi:MAG: F0F1 ATP synthase subunit B [Candidatus Krumholzibacteriia bacterium]|nr:F0F1 ATP synthase subunit B [bacterium]MCB9514219.1 F0F1 ATP synthase subunit B [Candidatus Latescibacterota bacterium]MCB9515888.1 F0F1 ATP synthase subunit B [Candidatus Latescibacterota bacterium]